MKTRKLLIASLLLVAVIGLAVTGWYVWRKRATPEPPAIPLADVEAPMAEVIRKAQDEVRRDPRSAEAWGNLGMILAANGFDTLSSLECYERAERLNPNDATWPYLLGLDLFINGRPHDAIPQFAKALDLTRDPEHRTAVLFRLGLILIEDGQLDRAEQYLRELNKLDPNGPRVHYGLGLVAFARNDAETAREHLSLLTDVPFARKHANGVLATLSAADPEQARKYHEQVKQLPTDQNWPDPFVTTVRKFKYDRMRRIARFHELRDAGRSREAVRFLQSFVAQSPDEEVCTVLAYALFEDGQIEPAEQMFRQLINYDARNVKAHLYLGMTLYLQGKKAVAEADGKDRARKFLEEAIVEEDRALALDPGLGKAFAFRGHSLRYLGRNDEAATFLRRAVLADPDVWETHMFLGETLGELGQFPDALEHLKYAIELAPTNDERPQKALEKWQARAREPRNKQGQ
jgi:tetratricopeptide (TPR) repeat protein